MRPANTNSRDRLGAAILAAKASSIGAALGALVFFACSVTCYGQGFVSHWSLVPDAFHGAAIGGACGLLSLAVRGRPLLFVLLCGLGCGLIAFALVSYVLSQFETAPMNRTELWRMLYFASLFHVVAGSLTGAAIAFVPRWIMDLFPARLPDTASRGEHNDGEEMQTLEQM